MSPLEIEKIKSFATYILDNQLKEKFEKVTYLIGKNCSYPMSTFTDVFGQDDKKMMQHASYFLSDDSETAKWIHTLGIAIYEVLHERRIFKTA